MIMTTDLKSFTNDNQDGTIFHRLYAPAAPHTTSSKGRSCVSCHNNPLALGYGEGKLEYLIENGKGKWEFQALYAADKNDGLPADAWIDFLQTREGKVSTRSDVFPLNVNQQQRTLTVGACLTCHDEKSDVMQKSLNHFDDLLKKRSAKCILPEWK